MGYFLSFPYTFIIELLGLNNVHTTPICCSDVVMHTQLHGLVNQIFPVHDGQLKSDGNLVTQGEVCYLYRDAITGQELFLR